MPRWRSSAGQSIVVVSKGLGGSHQRHHHHQYLRPRPTGLTKPGGGRLDTVQGPLTGNIVPGLQATSTTKGIPLDSVAPPVEDPIPSPLGQTLPPN